MYKLSPVIREKFYLNSQPPQYKKVTLRLMSEYYLLPNVRDIKN